MTLADKLYDINLLGTNNLKVPVFKVVILFKK